MCSFFNPIALSLWESYLTHGFIQDHRAGLIFFGKSSYGHLAGATIGAIIFNYYFVKSLKSYKHES